MERIAPNVHHHHGAMRFAYCTLRVHVQNVILITDENGSAETVVDFDAELPEALSTVSLVLTAELGVQSAHITLPAGNKG